MADEVKTVKDEQILTERKFPRRSFLTATGALLAGAVAVASGVRASAQNAPQKAADPDMKDKPKKPMHKSSTMKKPSSTMAKKASDPDSKDKPKKSTMAKPKPKTKTPPKSDPDGARL